MRWMDVVTFLIGVCVGGILLWSQTHREHRSLESRIEVLERRYNETDAKLEALKRVRRI